MWLDNAAQDAVDLFWARCGVAEGFPRTLIPSVSLALPLSIVHLPRLGINVLEVWLRRRNIHYQFRCQDRSLRGCLVAFGGQGIVFVEGADPDDQRRFTIAHEVAHFMLDYWLPRNRAIMQFGSEIAEVFDSLRQPTIGERVQALRTNLRVGVHVDLIERDAASDEVWKAENRADKVAVALLAPPREVLAATTVSAPRYMQRKQMMEAVLIDRFGIPASIATVYCCSLLDAIGRGASWSEALKK